MAFRLLILFLLSMAALPVHAQSSDWECTLSMYNDGNCDCGCGEFDAEDCADESAPSCDSDYCPAGEYPGYVDNYNCYTLGTDPNLDADWVCYSYWYGDGGCDCGCGALDVDCTDAALDTCEFDECSVTWGDDFYPGFADHTQCYSLGEDPALTGWSCSPYFISGKDNECDCGCGLFDDDCPDETIGSCESNNCAANEMVSSTNNALCIPTTNPDTDDSDTTSPDSDSTVDTGEDTASDTADSETTSDSTPTIVERELPTDNDDTESGNPSQGASGDSGGCTVIWSSQSKSFLQLLF